MQRNLTAPITGAPTQRRKVSPFLIGGAALILAAAAGLATWQGVTQRESSTPVTEADVVAVAPSTVPPTSADPPTIYLVGSPAEATQTLGAIAESNLYRHHLGEPPFSAEVLVVTSAEEEAAVLRASHEGDAIRASLGLAPFTMVDLRPTGEPAEFAAPVTTGDVREGVAPRGSAETEAPTIYLAGTQAEADARRTTLDDGAALTEAVNMLPAATSAVTVIGTADAHGRLLQLVGATDAVNAALGLPLLQIVDRRAS